MTASARDIIFNHSERVAPLGLIAIPGSEELGKKVNDYLVTWSREAGYRQLYLETHSNLQIAIRLYKKLGFTEIERPKEVLHSTMDHFYIKHL